MTNDIKEGEASSGKPSIYCRISNVLRSASLWTVVSALAGVSSAVAAFLTIQASNQARLQEMKAGRPYFVLVAPKFQNVDNRQILNLNIQNNGARPASSVTYQLTTVEQSLVHSGKAASDSGISGLDSKYEISSELSPNQPFPWWLDVKLPANTPPYFFRLTISYSDTILGDSYSQKYDMKWDGVKNGQTNPDLTFTSRTQSELMDAYFLASVE